MEYREIVAITGLGGLYQLLTTKSDGAIVRNVADKSTRFISARQHNVTPLESIEVYTTGENVRLHHVFQKMKENEAAIPLVDAKTADNAAIKNYFKSIFPEFDEERVYVSDMKKMLKWYDILKANDLLRFEEQIAAEAEAEEAVTTEEPAAEPVAEAAVAPKPKASKSPAKAAAAAAEPTTQAEGEEKPKRKKKAVAEDAVATEGEEKPAKKTAKKKKTEE
jgi:hypothetical protein